VWIGLLVIRQTDQLDWESVPQRMRPVLKATVNVGRAAFLILVALFVWSARSHHPASSHIVEDGLIVLLFAWEALFFAYGEMKALEHAE
jgi:hypothetical protein